MSMLLTIDRCFSDKPPLRVLDLLRPEPFVCVTFKNFNVSPKWLFHATRLPADKERSADQACLFGLLSNAFTLT